MPLWKVDVEKLFGAEYWTNRYIVDAPDIDTAGSKAAAIAQIERTVHRDLVTFTRWRVDDGVKDTDVFMITTMNVPGQYAAGAFPWLPLFNVAVVDFAVTLGRPSRKYLRLPLLEEDVHNGQLIAGVITHLNTNYVNPLVMLEGYVDVDGQNILSGAVKPAVGMRQLRRGSKRKAQPVIVPL
jgi:hypothetical protein